MSEDRIEDLLDYRVLPVAPGYSLWWHDEQTGELHSPTPIVGWVVERRRRHDDRTYFWATLPVTAEDVADIDNWWVIQYPDGRVCFPEDQTLPSLDHAKKYATDRAQKRRPKVG